MFIKQFFTDISAVATRVAPENENNLIALCTKHGFFLSFVNEPGFTFRVNTNTKEIKLPYGGLEYLWLFSLRAWLIYQGCSEAQQQSKIKLDLNEINGFPLVEQMTKDAKNRLHGAKFVSLDEACIIPNITQSDSKVATELFLCALGWIIFHEIGHIVLGHSSLEIGSLSVREEQDADKYSTDWIMGNSSVISESKKRVIGISIALLTIQSLELDGKSCFKNSHPDAAHRIFDNLSPHSQIDNEISQAMSLLILQSMTTINIESMDNMDFSQMLGEALWQVNVAKR